MSKSQEIWFFKGSRFARLLRAFGRRYSLRVVDRSGHRVSRTGNRSTKLVAVPDPTGPAVWLLDPEVDSIGELRRLARRHSQLRLIAVVSPEAVRTLSGREWFTCLPRDAKPAVFQRALESAFANIALTERERRAREELVRAKREQEELNRIGVALSATHDVGALLEMILAKTREITGADAGCLYVLESESPTNGSPDKSHRRLRFQLTQNDSTNFELSEYTLPISEDSVTGYAAMHGEVIALDDAYDIPPDRPYRFSESYDKKTGYKTRSLLTVPMKNARGEVIGVVQLLNCKRDSAARLLTQADIDSQVQPFPARAIRLAESLASQAAVAYENSRLYRDIESLFEGFVQAAVTAIEQRDPTTSGHSLRVSRMTVGLAEIVDRSGGSYQALHFTRDQMKEIRYAALLHDFGKVGVREEVLIKAKKLYPSQFEVVQGRFDYVHKEMEARCEREKVRALLDLPREEALRKIETLDEEFCRRSEELEDAFSVIVASNEPTVLASSQFERLFEVARRTFLDPRGVQRPLLTAEETRFLSIPRGSLDQQERQQIESHVVHSFNFLMQIPWTQTIHEIPEIVRAHHEKMNGTGYPYRLKGEEIPIQARMMTICDIFDALSSSDRPYKKAVPPERALAILEDSVSNHELDSGLFQLFLQGRVYDLLNHPA